MFERRHFGPRARPSANKRNNRTPLHIFTRSTLRRSLTRLSHESIKKTHTPYRFHSIIITEHFTTNGNILHDTSVKIDTTKCLATFYWLCRIYRSKYTLSKYHIYFHQYQQVFFHDRLSKSRSPSTFK